MRANICTSAISDKHRIFGTGEERRGEKGCPDATSGPAEGSASESSAAATRSPTESSPAEGGAATRCATAGGPTTSGYAKVGTARGDSAPHAITCDFHAENHDTRSYAVPDGHSVKSEFTRGDAAESHT